MTDAFLKAKADFDALLAQVRALSDNHFNAAPDDITWGDVGSVEEASELLRRVLSHFNVTGRS